MMGSLITWDQVIRLTLIGLHNGNPIKVTNTLSNDHPINYNYNMLVILWCCNISVC